MVPLLSNQVTNFQIRQAAEQDVPLVLSFIRQLAEYEPPPLDPAIDEALIDYMTRRKASFPDSNV